MANLSLNPTARAFLRLRAISPHSARRAGLERALAHHALNRAQRPENTEPRKCETHDQGVITPSWLCVASFTARQAHSPAFSSVVCHYLTTIGSPESPSYACLCAANATGSSHTMDALLEPRPGKVVPLPPVSAHFTMLEISA